MAGYNPTSTTADPHLARVQRQVDDVRGVMVDNIQLAVKRGEQMDKLVDKTDELSSSAGEFRGRARDLRRTMWWNSFKFKMLMVGLVIVLAIVIFLIACYSGGRNCTKKSGGGGGGDSPVPSPSPSPSPSPLP
mmetsp:Transcript_22874/g.58319  ORF Transcript_22874/g.58319 Transcript_22874/m.58319 type:complete len:133 (-) Transcript_22874:273-671(-)|eukprot:CAMPEP_0202857712 /NCGR_PEP_ID=MMETSP1391-20130828/547_1 /ASSEMBLY_ACC=CAM_ASM_000867 /TAXON_ID=1034604 /ORGANISM="Chlamydomonas leiostraca, Strain SAG 11-49" /LENGTH=132 /DNA_ID=CAMNT_0049536551 /DNA_START=117 /DNA_END=515 /DNA_ORIENTATION=+